MMAAIVVPARSRSIAMTCAFLVPARVLASVPETTPTGTGRFDDLRLAVFAGRKRVGGLRLDFVLVMGSSEVCATESAAPPQPHSGKLPGGARPKSAPRAAPGPHSNAQFAAESQSIRSKMIALLLARLRPAHSPSSELASSPRSVCCSVRRTPSR
jgi:hypothetical protein